LEQRALAILQGKESPPSEMVAFLVERAKETRNQVQVFAEQIIEAEKRLSQLRSRVLELRGATQSYAEDVKRLLQSEKKIVSPNQRIVTP
jgi:DNA repair ATPase RecN